MIIVIDTKKMLARELAILSCLPSLSGEYRHWAELGCEWITGKADTVWMQRIAQAALNEMLLLPETK